VTDRDVHAEAKSGKELVRDADGSLMGAIDTRFVELRWDVDRARRQAAA
jgi:hypothetical protein